MLVGEPPLGVRPSRAEVSLFSHAVIAVGLSSTRFTWCCGSGMVMFLRPYSVFKVLCVGIAMV